jgi:O-antigen ligase
VSSLAHLRSPQPIGLSGRLARGLGIGAVVAAVAGIAILTYRDMTTIGLAVALGVLLLLVGLRWPMLPLSVYVAAIPFDDVVRLGDFGSLGRSAAIVFVIAYVLPRVGRLTLAAMPVAGWMFMGWAILSIGWSLDSNLAVNQIGTLVQLFVVAVLIADVVVQQPTMVRPLLWVYSISAALSAVVGISNYLGGQLVDGSRAAALADQNPAQFGAILLPAFIFGLHELLAGRLKLPSAAVTLVTGLAIILTGTRGIWLGAALVTIFLVIPRLNLRQQVIAVGLVAAITVLAVQIPGVADFVAQRTGTAISTGGAGRTNIWAVGLGIIESSPIVGVGHGNFPVAYTPEMIRETVAGDLTDVGRGPHNLIVGTLGELGVIGLILLAAFLGPMLLRPGWGSYGSVVQAILASIIVSALFLDVLSNRKQVWLIIGLAAGLTYLRRPGARQGPPTHADASGATVESG